jgi:protein-L-isoaspartate(D-aspartate) O-methyltransferase
MPAKNLEEEFKKKREQLVFFMESSGALKTPSIKKAFLETERELFLPEELRPHAYADEALPLVEGQTISQPSTIAVMLEQLELKEGEKVLEVGLGSGYVAALLSKIVGAKGKVFGVEYNQALFELAQENLKKTKPENISIKHGDGSQGWEEKAPFDRILVSAACPFIPKPLFEQVKEKGTIVAPVGDRFSQEMVQAHKFKGKLIKKSYMGLMFAFVPLKGKFGWRPTP